MDKKMWIVACMCFVMGFMYGWSAKDIDGNGLADNQMIISTNTPETTELCISDVVSITKTLDTCETDRNEWEHRFNIAMAVNEDLGVAAKKAQELTALCIEAFKKASGLQ